MTPRVGMITTVRGVRCRIISLHDFGTITVQEVNGDRCWRISGLPLFKS